MGAVKAPSTSVFVNRVCDSVSASKVNEAKLSSTLRDFFFNFCENVSSSFVIRDEFYNLLSSFTAFELAINQYILISLRD